MPGARGTGRILIFRQDVMTSLQGHLLIAAPQLPDGNFYRSVVLIIQHSDEGASGLILNRPSEVNLQDIWSQVADSQLDRDANINIGGPVEGPLMALHDRADVSPTEVLPGVYLSIERDQLDELVGCGDGHVKFFSGYSGWGAGQLEMELEVGGWLTTIASPQHVFEDPESLWQSVCEQVGQGILFDNLGSLRIPDDPSHN